LIKNVKRVKPGKGGGERRESSGIIRDGILRGRESEKFPALKIPRQGPHVFPVKAFLREGEALGGEEGKALGSGLCYEQRREVGQRL
jgi:hypothetical protein